MIASVYLYSNTGYNPDNIPSSPTVLGLVGDNDIRVVPDVAIRQEYDLTTIQLETTWQNVKDADYMELVAETSIKAYYAILNAEMVSTNTARLTLWFDPINTANGVESINIIGGMTERRHVSDDELGLYNQPEPFVPQYPKNVTVSEPFFEKDQNNLETGIAVSTVNLKAIGKLAETFVDTNSGLSVAIPLIPAVTTGSTYTIRYGLPDGTRYTRIKYVDNQNLFELSDNEVTEALRVVRSIGIEGAILDTVSYDPDWVEGVGTIRYGLQGKPRAHRTSLTFIDAFGIIRNKKAFGGQFQKWTLKSQSSGDSITFDMEDLIEYDANNEVRTSPGVSGWADPSPAGRPYARPTVYRGESTNPFNMAVSGSTWEKVPITYTTNSQQFQADVRQKFSTIRSVANIANSVTQAVVGAGAGDLALASSGVSNLSNDAINNVQNQIDYQIQKDIVTPEVHFPKSDSLANYTGNSFVWVRETLHNQDLLDYDRFLSMYGYAVSEMLSTPQLNCRTKYNYIKTRDAHIKSSKGLRVSRQIQDVLNRGVRLWHTIPTSTSYNDENPVRS